MIWWRTAQDASGRGPFGRDPSVRAGSWHHSWMVIAVATLLVILGPHIVAKMLGKTHNIGWEKIPNSPSLIAADHVKHFFPKRMSGAIVMAVEAIDDTPSVLTDVVKRFSQDVSHSVAHDSRVMPYKPIVLGYYLDIKGYHPPKALMEKEFVSSDKKMTLIFIQPTKMEGHWPAANAFLQEWCVKPPPGYTLHITGMPAVESGNGCFSGVHAAVNTKDMNFECLFMAEICTFPAAILVMAYIVKSPRLLLLPLFTCIVSFVVSSAIIIPWMDVVVVPQDGPAAMGSLTLALCLDYSLFILSRFSEQHIEDMPLQENIDLIKRYTGRTIMVSAILVAIALFGSILLPERNLQGTGLCLGFATISCMGVSVVLTPAVLLVAGKFFAVGTFFSADSRGHQYYEEDQQLQGYIHDEVNERPESSQDDENSWWLKGMRCVALSPAAAMFIVLLLLMPILWHVPSVNITGDRFALLPMYMPALTALRRVQQSFPVGVLDPYAILITSPEQGATVHLNTEIKDGLSSLRSHDVRAAAAKLGMSSTETDAITAAVADVNNGRWKDLEDRVGVDPTVVASVRAGAASAIDKAHGASNTHSLNAAIRAAKETGCSSDDIGKAVGAAAAVLYSKSKSAADHIEETVRTEALKLGFGPATAAKIAAAAVKVRNAIESEAGTAAKGAHGIAAKATHSSVQQNTETVKAQGSAETGKLMAAAKAGAAAGRGKLHGKNGLDSLKDTLQALEGLDITTADVAKVVHASAEIKDLEQKGVDQVKDAEQKGKTEAVKQSKKHRDRLRYIAAAALMAISKETNRSESSLLSSGATAKDAAMHAASKVHRGWDEAVDKRWPLILDVVDAVARMTDSGHGMILMPSGYAAMLDLCDTVQAVGSVASMMGPTWALHQRIDWVSAVAVNVNSTLRDLYRGLLDSHVSGRRALLEVHTSFPSIGAGGANWVLAVREALATWESKYPGYKVELAGGASDSADMRTALIDSMWSYLGVSVSLIMVVVYYSFHSLMVPIRLTVALFFTLAFTFGTGAIVYQTPLLHGLFPNLANFDGIAKEVIPLITGIGIALGLDYDIFLVSRIVEFRLQRFSDRASIFRGVLKTGKVISGAGLIMSLAFSGLCFSDKLLFQQFGLLLIVSVLFDTFVVRTVLVPALMLMVQKWNWWPREMPPPIHDVLEGEVESCGGLSQPILGGTILANKVVPSLARHKSVSEDSWYPTSGMIA